MLRRVPPYEACGGFTPARRNALRRAGTGSRLWGLHFSGTILKRSVLQVKRSLSEVTESGLMK